LIYLYPTDTVFGLGVDARDGIAIARLRSLKGSGAEKHYSIAVSDIDMMRHYAVVTPLAEKLVHAFLPGKLTIVLEARNLPKEICEDGTIGIRIPDYPVVHDLIKRIGGPITATSANVSGLPPQATIEKILEQFGDRASEISYDPTWPTSLPPSLPSTVVDAQGTEPRLIREGAVLFREIEKVAKGNVM